jgi:hypothetical protein
MKLRRLRDGDVLEDGDVVLVRGGELDLDILRADAARYHSIYGVYGISVFAVRDATVDELAQQAPLVRFDRLTLLTVRDVLAAGMRLEPTGRNPRHYTVGFDDLEDGVRRLASRPYQVVPNVYYDA